MVDSIEDVIAVFAGLTVLWVIFGLPSKRVDDGRGHRLEPGGSADGRPRRPTGAPGTRTVRGLRQRMTPRH
jgi:hypothetical protein